MYILLSYIIILYYIISYYIIYYNTYIHTYIYILYILNGILTSTFRLKGSNPPPSQRHAWNRSVPASPNGRGHRHEASPDAKGSWEISSFNFQWLLGNEKSGIIGWLLDDYWLIVGSWLVDSCGFTTLLSQITPVRVSATPFTRRIGEVVVWCL